MDRQWVYVSGKSFSMKYEKVSRSRVAQICRRTSVAIIVSGVLSGCSSLMGPDRLEIPANTNDFKSRLYAGASVGNSRLTPDTRGTVFNVDSSSDMGTQLRLGYDLHNMLAVELETSVLGASQLREANTDVKYSSAAVSALIYGLNGVQLRSRREGLSAYAKLGYGTLKKSSAVLDLEESGAVPILGLGAEYGFANGLGIRAEITRFDGDATYVGFGAIYRFGISPQGIGLMIADAAEPALGAAHTTVARDGRVLSGPARGRFRGVSNQVVASNRDGSTRPAKFTASNAPQLSAGMPSSAHALTMADRWRPAMRAGDRDTDGVLDTADNCPDTATYVTVDRYGCGLFDAVLEDVTFKAGSRWLSPRARGQLDRVSDTLLAFPESRVQVRAHTDSQGPADSNLGLSSRRAEVVVQYLISRGVDELQMQAVGLGEAQPIDSNKNKKGRRRNRRVDLVTLPDQDAGHLLVAANVGTARVVTVTDPARRDNTRDDHAVPADEWNSAPRWPSQSAKSSTSKRNTAQATARIIEPGLLGAQPVTAEDQESDTDSEQSAGRNKPAAILPLPEPGFAPGLGISGVVDGLSFAAGSSVLNGKAKQALASVSKALIDNPEIRIAIMAHTDNKGDASKNMGLSKARAQAVVQHFVQQGVSANRLIAEGYGELLPLVQNVSDSDRAKNRRVEIRIEQN